MRQLVPLVAILGLWACGAITELPDGAEAPREGEGLNAGSGGRSGDGDGDGDREPDAGPRPPPIIEVCFAAGTPIATPSGERAIERLEVGDAVWAYDVERGARVLGRVSAVHRHEPTSLGRLQTPDGRALLVTPNHPIYVREQNGFVPASELTGGETLVQLDEHDQPVAAVANAFVPEVAREPVWNLTVEGVHTYFAGGVLVHNKSPPPPDCPWPNQSPYDCRPPWEETCFAPGTMIDTPSGERAIESLRIGDVVWGFDTARGTRVRSRVSAVHRHEAREVGAVALATGKVLYATAEHPFYDARKKDYVPASELTADSALLTFDATAAAVRWTSAEYVEAAKRSVVHNITVDGVHNYFAGGVLVHNKEAPPCPTYNWSDGTGCEHPVLGQGPECEPYPAPALSLEAYAARVDELLSVHDAGGTPVAPLAPDGFVHHPPSRAIEHRNLTLASLFEGGAGFELGALLARWLRVPAPAAPSASGTLDEQLYWQLATNLGRLISEPEGATVAELLQYSESAITPELAVLYGIPQISAETTVPWPPERQGVLGEIAFLRAHPTPSDRGFVIGELLACRDLSEHVPPMLPPIEVTTRYDAYRQLAGITGCAECHALFDPLGLPLEVFDELGAHRTSQNGFDLMPQGAVTGVVVTGPEQLAVTLAADVSTPRCTAISLLAAVLGRALVPADECSVRWVSEGMQGQGDMRGALLSALTSPAFLHEAP